MYLLLAVHFAKRGLMNCKTGRGRGGEFAESRLQPSVHIVEFGNP